MANYLVSHPAWFILYLVVLAFIGGVIIDIDHPLHYFMGWGEYGQFLHKYLIGTGLLFVSSGIGILITLVCRLYK